MTGVLTSGSFIAGPRGRILVLKRQPAASSLGCVLVVPAFAEEMNKCRRMVTETMLALAARGIASVVPDLHGTGDSEGDFATADWNAWMADLAATCNWSSSSGNPVTALLTVRLGCALAAQALQANAIPAVRRTVLWQPVLDGRRFMTQFIRQRIAASRMQTDRSESMEQIRALLRAGSIVEVAGYCLTSRLVDAIEKDMGTDGLPAGFGDMSWMELTREAGAELSAPAAAIVRRSRELGRGIEVVTFTGEPYWAATETLVHSEIVAATVNALSSAERP